MSLVNTLMQNVRVASNMDKYEFRASQYGAYDMYLRQTKENGGIISPEMASEFFGSIGRTFQTSVINHEAPSITVGQARSITVSDSENTSAMLNLTPVSYQFGFTMVPTLYLNNEIKMQRDFEIKMRKYILSFLNTVDALCVGNLSTNKTSVFADAVGMATTGNTLTATAAQKDELLTAVRTAMAANDYFDSLHVVGDYGLKQHIEMLKQHGLYNDQYKALEYNGLTLGFTKNVQRTASTQRMKGYAVQRGSVGILTRLDREALARTKTNLSYEWDQVHIPEIGLTFGAMQYESVGDFSGIAGAASADMTASHKLHFGFSIDMLLVNAYNSDPTTLAQPIMEFAATIA